MIKKIITALMIAALPAGFAVTAFSAQNSGVANAEKVVRQAQEEKGELCTVTGIEGNKVSLKKQNDEQFTIDIKNSKDLQNLKAGDMVLVKNGEVTKEKEE